MCGATTVGASEGAVTGPHRRPAGVGVSQHRIASAIDAATLCASRPGRNSSSASRNATYWPRATASPAFLEAATPRFDRIATVQSGHRKVSRLPEILSSVEQSSTTIISSAASRCCASPLSIARHTVPAEL